MKRLTYFLNLYLKVLHSLNTMLSEKYHIGHVTIQFECNPHQESYCAVNGLYCHMEVGKIVIKIMLNDQLYPWKKKIPCLQIYQELIVAQQLGVEKEHATQTHLQSRLGQIRLGIWIGLIALFWMVIEGKHRTNNRFCNA